MFHLSNRFHLANMGVSGVSRPADPHGGPDMKTETLDALVNKLTAFRTVAELRAAQVANGYVPSIYRHYGAEYRRLGRELEAAGIRVWYGS
jgi:hypothetical protein